jgi:hypothetical protein
MAHEASLRGTIGLKFKGSDLTKLTISCVVSHGLNAGDHDALTIDQIPAHRFTPTEATSRVKRATDAVTTRCTTILLDWSLHKNNKVR